MLGDEMGATWYITDSQGIIRREREIVMSNIIVKCFILAESYKQHLNLSLDLSYEFYGEDGLSTIITSLIKSHIDNTELNIWKSCSATCKSLLCQ